MSLEAQNAAAEIRLWACRRAGEMLASTVKASRPIKVSHDGTLSELGINRNQSSRWQAIAEIDGAGRTMRQAESIDIQALASCER